MITNIVSIAMDWRRRNSVILAFALLIVFGGIGDATEKEFPKIEWIANFEIPGNQIDRSGLNHSLGPEMWQDLFGGISAMDYVGRDDLFIALADRGPLDGAVDWRCRFHLIRIPVLAAKTQEQKVAIEETVLLKNESSFFAGLASRYKADGQFETRLDPEGVRLAGDAKSIYLTDEYGPDLLQFSLQGQLIRRITLPTYYRIAAPGATKKAENSTNDSGRQGNRGMEGLAIDPSDDSLYGLMQSPLLQDCRRTKAGKPKGLNCRLLELSGEDQTKREYVYQLEDEANKLNEILWYARDQFLVIERDGLSGSVAQFKKIMWIDLSEATEVVGQNSLPAGAKLNDIAPVRKRVFIDLLDERYGLTGSTMPEKIEALTWGPRLKDGRRTLLIASDNDFKIEQPTRIYCFAIGTSNEQDSTKI